MDHGGKLPSEQPTHSTSPPLISQVTAHALSALFTVTYVLPFYLFRRTRPSPTLTRDAPDVIRARITLVSIACCACASVTLGILLQRTHDDERLVLGPVGHGRDGYEYHHDGLSEHDTKTRGGTGGGGLSLTEAARLLGWWPVVLSDVARVMVLTGILFAGPLFEAGIVEGGWRWWGRWEPVKRVLGTWIGVRSFIAGPASEEFIFRSLILTLHVLSLSPLSSRSSTDSTVSVSTPTPNPTRTPIPTPLPPPPPHTPPHFPPLLPLLLLLPPFYFAIAHIHHYYEFRLTHPHVGAGPALARSVLQFGYTSLFGAYAGFVFLRTGSLLAVILAHAFCNWIGLPRLWGWVGGDCFYSFFESSDDQSGRTASGKGVNQKKSKVMMMMTTIAYYFLLVAGAVGFYMGLYPFTRSERAIVRFED